MRDKGTKRHRGSQRFLSFNGHRDHGESAEKMEFNCLYTVVGWTTRAQEAEHLRDARRVFDSSPTTSNSRHSRSKAEAPRFVIQIARTFSAQAIVQNTHSSAASAAQQHSSTQTMADQSAILEDEDLNGLEATQLVQVRPPSRNASCATLVVGCCNCCAPPWW